MTKEKVHGIGEDVPIRFGDNGITEIDDGTKPRLLNKDNEKKKRGWPRGKPRKVNGVIHTRAERTSHKSGIVPFEFKVLVRQEKVEEKTRGGIIIPEPAREDQQRAMFKGVIEDISPAAFSYHNWDKNVRLPKVGDRVVFARYSGSIIIGKDEVEYRLINDKDIGAILDFTETE